MGPFHVNANTLKVLALSLWLLLRVGLPVVGLVLGVAWAVNDSSPFRPGGFFLVLFSVVDLYSLWGRRPRLWGRKGAKR